jgi:hypothetical protein
MPEFDFAALLKRCRATPGYLYHDQSSHCVCGADESHQEIDRVINCTLDQFKTLVEEGHVDLSRTPPYYEWKTRLDKIPVRRWVEFIEFYLDRAPELIVKHRSSPDEGSASILTSFYSCGFFNPDPFVYRLLSRFLAAGMDFSDHYWMLWVALRGSDSATVEFLLTHGMSVKESLARDKDGKSTEDESKSCLGEGLLDMLRFLKEDKDENEKSGRTDYRQAWNTVNVLYDHGLRGVGEQSVQQLLTDCPNPYWKWEEGDYGT